MTEHLLNVTAEEALIREVARRVCERLVVLQKRALVVCTGSGLSFSVWKDALCNLEKAGYRFSLFVSRSAEFVLDLNVLQDELHFERVFRDDGQCVPEQLAGEYATVIVPALTINTAAKIASCHADTPAARIVLTSMMRGKNVILSVDGCCPDNPERTAKGYKFTEPLKEQLRTNMKRLKDYGATLATADKLMHKVFTATSFHGGIFADEHILKQTNLRGAYHCGDGIIGRSYIAGLPEGAVLHIKRGCRLTQLAADTARARGIQIRIAE